MSVGVDVRMGVGGCACMGVRLCVHVRACVCGTMIRPPRKMINPWPMSPYITPNKNGKVTAVNSAGLASLYLCVSSVGGVRVGVCVGVSNRGKDEVTAGHRTVDVRVRVRVRG